MTKYVAEDMRDLLNKLDEYIISVTEEEKDPVEDDTNPDEDNENDNDENAAEPDDTIDDVLTDPPKLEKIVGSLNIAHLIQVLEIPEAEIKDFKSAIAALKVEDPILTTVQAAALATAFNHVITRMSAKSGDISKSLNPHHVGETLDSAKIKSYMARDASRTGGTMPTKPTGGPDDSIEQMKGMIDAVKKHGSPGEKKEVGLGETMSTIIAYNSGHGEQLAQVANDPSRRRQVDMIEIRLDRNNRPVMVFRDNGNRYTADYSEKYGWVADFD